MYSCRLPVGRVLQPPRLFASRGQRAFITLRCANPVTSVREWTIMSLALFQFKLSFCFSSFDFFPATSFACPDFSLELQERIFLVQCFRRSFSVPVSSNFFIQVSPLFACGFVRCFSSSFFILPFVLGTVVYVCWLWVSACLLALRPELCPVSCP